MKIKIDVKKIALYGLIISLILSALAGIYIFLFGEFRETEEKILITTMSLACFSLCGLCCSFLYNKNRYIGLALGGLIFSAATFLYSIVIIWVNINDDIVFRSFFISMIITICTAHGCLMLLVVPVRKLILYLRTFTLFFNVAFGIMLSLIIILDTLIEEDFFFRLLGVFAILVVLGSILTPLLHKVMPVKITNQETDHD
jgi:hypothetical protein